MIQRFRTILRNFFFPPQGSPRWAMVLPYVVLGVLTLLILTGGAYGWAYTNSSQFCGTSCHTMPPEYAAYEASPHARVACVECHIGREFIGNQIFRKAGDAKHLIAMTFSTYEYPIYADNMRPARESCELCHTPEKFSDDSLRVLNRFGDDKDNTQSFLYLVLKTGGGAKREGQGKGIHWHIVNKVEFYETDEHGQVIPYVLVHNDDGTTTEYVDIESGFDPKTIDKSKLKEMDCLTCHNRVTHHIYTPRESMDLAMAQGTIPTSIPEIHAKGIEVLSASYVSQQEGLDGIAKLEDYYKATYPDYYNSNTNVVKQAVTDIQSIFSQSVFIDQKINWDTHANNIGHINSPGCFRCHDGKHLDANQQAVRLECNLCHAIPVIANQQDFVTKIEISRGPEPDSHRNPNWISLHNKAFDQSCSACHTTEGAGSTANTSFCSNSACHGSTFTYAGFDAPKLREILQAQLPKPTPEPTAAPLPAAGSAPDYTANIAPLFVKCAVCHNDTALAGGLDLGSYETLMKGGKEGAVITPNDSANSQLIKTQSAQHFANFSADELALVKQWIDAGALEK